MAPLQGQTDEEELGFQYGEIDRLLNLMIDNKLGRTELIREGFQEDLVERVMERIRSSEYKRRMPVVAEISQRGKGGITCG
jgi:NAD+ synthase